MLFETLVSTSAQVASTQGRRAKGAALAECLGRLGLDEVGLGAAYLAGELPQGRIGVGGRTLHALHVAPAAHASLHIAQVQTRLQAIADVHGPGSSAQREGELRALFGLATAAEQRFLRHLLTGELRQGALTALVADAVAAAARVTPAAVQRALMLCGELHVVAHAAFDGGEAALGAFTLQLFRPVLPMLASPAADLDEVFGHLDALVLETKLDGARVQIHKDGDEVRVYSRQLNEVTAAVPEVVELARALPARRAILDGETLALHPGGRPRPFQDTMRRFGRRLDIAALRRDLPLSTFVFDCLRLDDDALLDRPTRERMAALEVVPAPARVAHCDAPDRESAAAFWESVLEAGHEGLVAKSLDAPYAAGRRGQSWLKLKPAHTLDLVVLAAEWGSGRRQGWLSNLHLGARDPQGGGFVMLGKTFKGLTDAMLTWQTEKLLALEIGRDAWTVYVRPELVAEIAFGDVQRSTTYPGGVALRFARVKRYREDKRADEADTIEAVRALAPRSS